jgi:hypothetical protein
MRRSLITATLALAIALLGFGVAAEAANTARNSHAPRAGRYVGRDVQGQTVRFFFNGSHVSHFTVGHAHMGDTAVSSGGWHNACHHGYCFNGSWTGSTQVHGSWRISSSSHHSGWHANLQHISGGETH